MAALTFEAVYRALKRGEIAPVYYLTGEADVLKEELVTAITRTAVDDASRDFNLDIRAAGDLDGEAVHSLLETPPLLAARRAVVVKNLEQWRANAGVWQVLLRYLERPSPTTVLVMLHGAGEKPMPQLVSRSQHVQLDALSPELLRRWVISRTEKAQVTLASEAVDHLIIAVGNDLSALAMEIEKLAAAVPPGETVTLTQVGELVGIRRGETLVDWVEAVLQRDLPTAISLLDVVLPQPGISGVRMATALGTALLGTRLAKSIADAGAAPRAIVDQVFRHLRENRPQGVGLWSDEAKRWTRATAVWSGPELDRALAAVYEADRSLKSSTLSDERGVLASLLLRIGARASGAGRAA